jgi:hypothetical protein
LIKLLVLLVKIAHFLVIEADELTCSANPFS